MKNIITRNNNRQDTGTKEESMNNSTPLDKAEFQALNPDSHNKPRHVSCESEQSGSATLQLAEEDRYDPDLTMEYSGNCAYMTQAV